MLLRDVIVRVAVAMITSFVAILICILIVIVALIGLDLSFLFYAVNLFLCGALLFLPHLVFCLSIMLRLADDFLIGNRLYFARSIFLFECLVKRFASAGIFSLEGFVLLGEGRSNHFTDRLRCVGSYVLNFTIAGRNNQAELLLIALQF